MDGADRGLAGRPAADVACADQGPYWLLDRLLSFLLHNDDRALGADLDALAAVGAALLPDAVRRESRLTRNQLLSLNSEVLAYLASLVAHRALVRVDLVAHKGCALEV
jgi:hypothetical protein